MAWSFGSNNGPSQEQVAMFGQAAQDSGLSGNRCESSRPNDKWYEK